MELGAGWLNVIWLQRSCVWIWRAQVLSGPNKNLVDQRFFTGGLQNFRGCEPSRVLRHK